MIYTPTGQVVAALPLSEMEGVAYDPARPLLFLANDSTLYAYDSTTLKLLHTFPIGAQAQRSAPRIAEDGSAVLILTEDGADSWAFKMTLFRPSHPSPLLLSPRQPRSPSVSPTWMARPRLITGAPSTSRPPIPTPFFRYYTFTASDAGIHTFSFTPRQGGTSSIRNCRRFIRGRGFYFPELLCPKTHSSPPRHRQRRQRPPRPHRELQPQRPPRRLHPHWHRHIQRR